MNKAEHPLAAVLLGPGGSLTPVQIAAAAEHTARIRFLVDSDHAHDLLGTIAESLAPTQRADFADLEACARAVAGSDVVTTFVDELCPLVSRLSHQTGALWGRKHLQRASLRAAGVSRLESATLLDEESVRRFAADAGFPFVIKPTDGVSSRDIWLVGTDSDLDRFLADFSATADVPSGLYAEQYLVGDRPPAGCLADYVSAELLVSAGVPAAAFVTDRLAVATPSRETGLVLPTSLRPQQEAAVIDSAIRALAALNVPDGAYHVEAKPHLGHADIVEVNGRLGGFITRLVGYGTGADLGRAALNSVLSRPVELQLNWHRAVLVLLYPPPAGATRIVTAPGRREIMSMPGVLAVDRVSAMGQPVSWRAGSAGAVTEVWLAADDHDQLWGRLADLAALLAERFVFSDSEGRIVADDGWTRVMRNDHAVGGNGE
jgi:hypothetical protein